MTPYKNKYIIPAWKTGNDLSAKYCTNGMDVVALVREGSFSDKIATPVFGYIMIQNNWSDGDCRDSRNVGIQVLDHWLPWDKVIAWRYCNKDIEFPFWHDGKLIDENMIKNQEKSQ